MKIHPPKNIGTTDRIIRIILGLVLCGSAFFVSSIVVQIVLVVLGIFSIYEALVGWCALYALIGRTTCPIE
ncbi:MAG TPA: DUF2892 domain-containing protein [Candidatus Paceibacterota bacterium]|jgi:hypothetical protein|nr:DUF2892 domain-containing protein [Candidatus Paceibacterota bacterium]